jgi:opacity protein-like surface antigen
MRKLAYVAAIAAMTASAPAYASGEGRVEARGGIAFAAGQEEAFVGGAAGYDFDLGDKAFVGVEAGVDKVLQGGSDVFFTAGARLGVKAGNKARVYALGGYGVAGGDDDLFIGGGVQFNLGAKAYGKVEYRRVLAKGSPDVNLAGVGFGIRF